jgi:hypothetical protein
VQSVCCCSMLQLHLQIIEPAKGTESLPGMRRTLIICAIGSARDSEKHCHHQKLVRLTVTERSSAGQRTPCKLNTACGGKANERVFRCAGRLDRVT